MLPEILTTSTVAPDLQPWTTAHPAYTPVDATPAQLRTLDAITDTALDWAEPIVDPARISWPVRQLAATLPFEVTAGGWPLNPAGRTGRRGRALGRWGENAAVDPVVIADSPDGPLLLLIARDDVIGQWALPGGMIDAGETVDVALLRELREETGLDLTGVDPHYLASAYVDDPRATDNAWICTTAALFRLPEPIPPTAGSDARDARWWPCHSLDVLRDAVAAAGGLLYAAHRPLLRIALTAAGQR